MSRIYDGSQYDGQEVYASDAADTVSGETWPRDADAARRPALAGSTALREAGEAVMRAHILLRDSGELDMAANLIGMSGALARMRRYADERGL